MQYKTTRNHPYLPEETELVKLEDGSYQCGNANVKISDEELKIKEWYDEIK